MKGFPGLHGFVGKEGQDTGNDDERRSAPQKSRFEAVRDGFPKLVDAEGPGEVETGKDACWGPARFPGSLYQDVRPEAVVG